MRTLAVAVVLVALATIACNAIVGFDDLTKQPSGTGGPNGDDDDGDDDDDVKTDGGSSSSSSGSTSGEAGSSGIVPACNPAADFGAAVPLPGPVNTSSFENSPGLSDDELTIVFQRSAGDDSKLFIATRAATDQPFGDPTELALTSSKLSFQPSLARDGLTVFWAEVPGETMDIFFATRTTTAGTFANPLATGVANQGFTEMGPGVTGDGDELFYASDQEQIGGKTKLYRATRTAGEYKNLQKVQELADGSNGEEQGVALSKDGLTIFFGSTRTGGQGKLDIWTAHRPSRSEKFTGVVVVNNVNSGSIDWPTFVSSDGCRLYFGSERSGAGDLYVATRGK